MVYGAFIFKRQYVHNELSNSGALNADMSIKKINCKDRFIALPLQLWEVLSVRNIICCSGVIDTQLALLFCSEGQMGQQAARSGLLVTWYLAPVPPPDDRRQGYAAARQVRVQDGQKG